MVRKILDLALQTQPDAFANRKLFENAGVNTDQSGTHDRAFTRRAESSGENRSFRGIKECPIGECRRVEPLLGSLRASVRILPRHSIRFFVPVAVCAGPAMAAVESAEMLTALNCYDAGNGPTPEHSIERRRPTTSKPFAAA